MTRWYNFGDVLESIPHGASLIRSFFTPKEAPGSRKLMDNVGYVLDNVVPEDVQRRTDLLDVLAGMMDDFQVTTTEGAVSRKRHE